jgi:hypothetical protein
VTRIVIGIAVGEMVVSDAGSLIEEPAPPAARHRVPTGYREGAVGGRPLGLGVGGATEKARGVDGGQRHCYFFESSQ